MAERTLMIRKVRFITPITTEVAARGRATEGTVVERGEDSQRRKHGISRSLARPRRSQRKFARPCPYRVSIPSARFDRSDCQRLSPCRSVSARAKPFAGVRCTPSGALAFLELNESTTSTHRVATLASRGSHRCCGILHRHSQCSCANPRLRVERCRRRPTSNRCFAKGEFSRCREVREKPFPVPPTTLDNALRHYLTCRRPR
jgi:hypothetical protein